MSGSAIMEEKPKITYRPRRELPPARIRRHWPGGIFWRELCAGLPTVLALAGLVALIALLDVLMLYFKQTWGQPLILPGYLAPSDFWSVIALIVFFLMGVLCGGEEAENGTADFARRLPVSRLHIYAAKTAGAMFSVAVWFLLSIALANLILRLGLAHFGAGESKALMIDPFHHPDSLGNQFPVIPIGLFLFFCGQAAAAWIERVIVGALVGGALAVFYLAFVYAAYAKIHSGSNRIFDDLHFLALVAGSAVALLAAFIRFQTREGR